MNEAQRQRRAERLKKNREARNQQRQQGAQRAQPQKPKRPKPKPQPRPTPRGNAANLGYNPGAEIVDKFNKTCYIIGGGPSLEHFNWSLLGEDKFIIAINRAYETIPNAQVVYFTDDDWYADHKKRGLYKHSGTKIKGSLNPSKLGNDNKIRQMFLSGPMGLDMKPNNLKHGRNSPYAACNMAIQWGFKKIYLLGIDLGYGRKDPKGKRGHKTHWHDGHRRIDGESTYKSFGKSYAALPKLIQPHNVTIISVNSRQNLKCFPCETYEEHFGPNWTTRPKN